MNFTRSEKTVLMILSLLLLTGTATLHIGRSRVRHNITITKNGFKEQFTLKDIEERLKEERRVSINTATAEELIAIPGIGQVFAQRIVEHRDRHGLFRSCDDLLEIKGFGEKKLEKTRPFIKIE
ncbi:MAG: helix-hairpin-helix domain-containing protein [Candidatus Omnitrophica bacterium]|nr:helix-hairpin-helix domain-containing protein [Candidatus Omnitrophota bacterium]